MLVYMDYADGLVAGATHSSSDVLRAALKTVKTATDSKIVSAFFLNPPDKNKIGGYYYDSCNDRNGGKCIETVHICKKHKKIDRGKLSSRSV